MRVQGLQFTTNCRDGTGRRPVRPCDQCGQPGVGLLDRRENERLRIFAEAAVFAVLYNPDHLNRRVIAAGKTEALADGTVEWIRARPEAARKGFIDHRDT